MTAERAVRAAKANLEVLCQKHQVNVQTIASKVLNRVIVLRLTPLDQIKLLNLRMWSLKYQVSLQYILTVLLEFWNNAPHIKRRKTPAGLGIQIATLCGNKSRQVLQEAMLRDYPSQENIKEMRSVLEAEVVLSQDVMGDAGNFRITDPRKFMVAYRARIRRARSAVEELQEQLRRRPWRGNPYR